MKNKKIRLKLIWVIELLVAISCIIAAVYCVFIGRCKLELPLAILWIILVIFFGILLFFSEKYEVKQNQKYDSEKKDSF